MHYKIEIYPRVLYFKKPVTTSRGTKKLVYRSYFK